MPDPAFAAIQQGDTTALKARLAAFRQMPAGHVHLSNLRDHHGRSLATLAAEFDRVDAIRCLAEAGVYMSAPDEGGRTALQMAADCGHVSAIDAIATHLKPAHILARGAGERTALDLAARNGHAAAVAALLRIGADPAAVDSQGEGSAHLAAREGHPDVVRVLLAHDRSSMERPNHFGETPAYIAADAGHHEVVRELVSAGANVYIPDPEGNHAAHVAALQGHAEMFGPGVLDDARQLALANDAGVTPAHVAAIHDKSDVLEALVRSGVPMPRGPRDWPADLDEKGVSFWQQRVGGAVGAVAIDELENSGFVNLAADLACRVTFTPLTETGNARPVRLPSVTIPGQGGAPDRVVQGSIVSAGTVNSIFHPPVHEIYGQRRPRDPLTNSEFPPGAYAAFVASDAFRRGDEPRLAMVRAVHGVYSGGGDTTGRAARADDAVKRLDAGHYLNFVQPPATGGPGAAAGTAPRAPSL